MNKKIIVENTFAEAFPMKVSNDREKLWDALNNDLIDVVATDHAPHTIDEKQNPYTSCPSGGPLVQHSLVSMLEAYHNEKISLEKIVQKMCHNPAILFDVEKRGFIREGFYADLVIFDLNSPGKYQKIIYFINVTGHLLKIRHLNLEYYTHWLTVILFSHMEKL